MSAGVPTRIRGGAGRPRLLLKSRTLVDAAEVISRAAPQMRTWAAAGRATAFALFAVAVAIDLFRVPQLSIWGDEGFSIGLVSGTWSEFWRYAWTKEVNMVLYHALLKVWLDVTAGIGIPPDEVVVRLPSVAFAGLAVVVVFWTGRRFWGATVGVVAAALLLLNHVMLVNARYTRAYTLEVFLVSLGWFVLLVAMSADRQRTRWWAAYALIMTAAVYAHLFSGLVLAAQVIAFGALLVLPNDWRARARGSLRAMVICIAAISVAILPLAVYAVTHGSPNLHVQASSPYEVGRALWNFAGHSIVYGLLLAAATTIGVLLTLRARRTRPWRRTLPVGAAIALCAWLAVPFALAYVASQPRLNLHLFAWGYLVVVVPALCLLAGVGVVAVRRPLARGALAVCLVVAAAFAIPQDTFGPSQDFRSAAAWIAEHYEARDGLVCNAWSCALAFSYYTRLDRLPAALLEASALQWSWVDGDATPLDLASVRAYTQVHPRIFFVESLVGGDRADVKARAAAAREWLDSRYPVLADFSIESSVGPVRVRLYETLTAAF